MPNAHPASSFCNLITLLQDKNVKEMCSIYMKTVFGGDFGFEVYLTVRQCSIGMCLICETQHCLKD